MPRRSRGFFRVKRDQSPQKEIKRRVDGKGRKKKKAWLK